MTDKTTATLPIAAPCERCGSADIFIEREDLSAYQARCNDCGSRGPIVEEGRYYDDEEAGQRDAIAAWNRRAAPSSLTPDEREYLLSRVTSELAEFSGDQRHMTKHEAERLEMLRGLAEKLRGGVVAPASPSAAQGWMPIETAPKDGARVLTATIHGGGYPSVSWWTRLDMIDREYGADAWCSTGTHVPWGHQPTHWMPLPAAPSDTPQLSRSGVNGSCAPDCEWPLCGCDPHAANGVPVLEEVATPANPAPPRSPFSGDFEQVLREMDCAARGEDADPEFDDEQMALIADWHARLLKALPAAAPSDARPATNEAWAGSSAAPGAQPAQPDAEERGVSDLPPGLVLVATPYRDAPNKWMLIELTKPGRAKVITGGYIETEKEGIAHAHNYAGDALSAARASAPAAPEVVEASETQATIGAWADSAFGQSQGPVPPLLRAVNELVEACIAAGISVGDIHRRVESEFARQMKKGAKADHASLPSEVAGTVIVLYRVAQAAGFDLQAAIDAEMRKNRGRRWFAKGDGTGHHIPATDAALRSAGEAANG